MNQALVLLVTLGLVAALAALAKRIRVPYPIACVVGGGIVGFFPSLPHLQFDPDTILMLVLPPLLFSAAWATDWYQFRRNTRPIALLAVGLVLFTMVVVAVVAHARIPGFTWAFAFVLGAIVSPPDAVASEAVFSMLPVPHRLVAIVSGECLVNDATALVLYRFAVAAALTGVFHPGSVSLAFVEVSIGGTLIGLAAAIAVELAVRLMKRRQIDSPTLVNVMLLLAPYLAYLPAEELHFSGVLAAVAAGIALGQRSSNFMDSEARVVGSATWQVLTFLLNAFVFVLIGLQLPAIVAGLGMDLPRELGYGALISAIVILVRVAWVFPATYLPRWLIPALRRADPTLPWQAPALLSWAGMRGVVSLAVALALPYELGLGSTRPIRAEIIFLTLCVIVVTLIGQGLTLGPLIRWLGLAETSRKAKREAALRIRALEAGITRLRGLEPTFSQPVEWEVAGRLLGEYEHRIEHLRGDLKEDEAAEDVEIATDRSMQQEALAAERAAIARMRADGEVPDEIYRDIEYDLDLAALRLK